MEEVEAERDSVLGAICRVKEKLQSVSDELCFFESDGDVTSTSMNDSSGSSGSKSSSNRSSSSTGSFFEKIEMDIRHKESEVQVMR